MEKYNKIFKWVMLGLMAISVIIVLIGSFTGFPQRVADDNGTVDPLLYWTYFMVGLTVFCAIVFSMIIMAKNDPKSLVNLGIWAGAVIVICLLAYALAAGSPAVGYNGEPVTDNTLKLTDTILILTAFAGIAVLASIVVGEIVSKIRNK